MKKSDFGPLSFSSKLKRIALLVCVLGLAGFFVPATRVSVAAVPTSGLVGHWKMDETTGNTVADSSSVGVSGTRTGGAIASGSSCKLNGCLQFNSSSSRVNIPNNVAHNTATGFSVSFWYKATSNSGSIIAKPYGSGTLNSWQFEFSGGLSFTSSNGSSQHFDTTPNPSVNTWHHVVGTWDGATKKMYVDGVQTNSVARTIAFDTKNIVIGGDYNGGSFVLPFSGFVDETRLFNRALNASEVTELFNEPNGVISPPPPPPTTSLTVTKVVQNDSGGTAVVADFPLQINGNTVVSGVANGLPAGNYTVTETNNLGYTATFSGACNAQGQVTLASGQQLVCTITNNDPVVTPPPPPIDTTPPIISSVVSGNINTTSATITWNTNEGSTSQVEYGATTSYGSSTTENTSLVTSHTVNLSGLAASTTYNFRVKSRDLAGNLATSTNFTFSTSAAGGGFQDSLVASGLNSPTAMQFAPDGRLFVAQQNGQLKVIKNGQLLSSPFMTLSVNSTGERGLLGIAFDPNFSSNNFLYVYYTSSSTVRNRVSRFTANGDVVLAGSEVVLLDLDDISNSSNHNGGALHFGPDGKLYIAVGDNSTGSNAQSFSNLHGKILRINPDGTIPLNPFDSQTTGNRKSIWALGLRNPFTFSFKPGTSTFFINDVGQDVYEEISEGQAGANYGWPSVEGNNGTPPSTPGTYKAPVYTYDHSGSAPNGCAITGGAFYNPAQSQYGSEYTGDYFFGDYCGGWIYRLNYNASGTAFTVEQFAGNLNSPVDIKISSNGSLYYASYGNGQVRKIEYVGAVTPSITTDPANVTVFSGQNATFSVAASGAPLNFQWQRAETGTTDFVDIPGATNSSLTITQSQLSDNGDLFRVAVSNSLATVISNPAILTVQPNDSPVPVITIDNGLRSGKFDAGTNITFSGLATDTEDGQLPATSLTWQVDYITTIAGGDSDNDGLPGITRPFQAASSGSSTGSFTPAVAGPYTLADVAYVIKLTATDVNGATSTATQLVYPNTVFLTLDSSLPGLQLTRDGQPVTSPSTFEAVVGFQRPIGAVSPQTIGSNQHFFTSWSDGGAQTHTVTTPTIDTTYTATFTVVPVGPVTTGWFFPVVQSPVTSSAGDNNGFQTNPANMLLDDGVYAVDIDSGTNTNTGCTNSGKDKHIVRDFTLALPQGKTVINGIEVKLDGFVESTANSPRFCVRLSWNGGSSWTSAKSTAVLTTTETAYILGSSTDKWGRNSWTTTQTNNTNFRVQVINIAGNASRDFSLDSVAVRITAQ